MSALMQSLPLSDRMRDLILATERDLDDGIAPLGHAFLCEHEVTIDEAYSLADTIALALKVFRTVPAMSAAMAIGTAIAESAPPPAPAPPPPGRNPATGEVRQPAAGPEPRSR